MRSYQVFAAMSPERGTAGVVVGGIGRDIEEKWASLDGDVKRILNGRRKKRIARGSGQSVPEINRLLKQFAQMKRMMKAMKAGTRGGKGPRLPFPGR